MTEQEGYTGIKPTLAQRIGSPFNVEYVLRALDVLVYQENISAHGYHFFLNFLTLWNCELEAYYQVYHGLVIRIRHSEKERWNCSETF